MNIKKIRKQIHKTDLFPSLFYSIIFAILLIISSFLSQNLIIILAFTGIFFMHIFLFKTQKRIQQKNSTNEIEKIYGRTQAYIELNRKINPVKSLPMLGGSAITPDLANILSEIILETKPSKIIECGSGVSSLISAYCVKKNKIGQIWSLDHEKKYLNISMEYISAHDLNNFVHLIYAPIINFTIDNKNYKFYDTKLISEINDIDLLFIDGPPRTINPNIRFAALPLFYNKIKKGGIIILDDANRLPEKEAINQWIKMYPDLKYKYFPTEKGTVILTKTHE